MSKNHKNKPLPAPQNPPQLRHNTLHKPFQTIGTEESGCCQMPDCGLNITHYLQRGIQVHALSVALEVDVVLHLTSGGAMKPEWLV